MRQNCQVKLSQQKTRPLAYRLLTNSLAAIYNASGFHVREDVAPLKLRARRGDEFVPVGFPRS